MLGKARQILVGELALAEPVDEAKVDEMETKIQQIVDEQAKAGITDEERDELDDDLDMDDLSFDDEDDDEDADE